MQDDWLLGQGLASLIETEPDFEIVATGELAPLTIKRLSPSIALLDFNLITRRGLRLIVAVKCAAPQTAIVLMGLAVDAANPVEFVRAGVSGFVLKEASLDDLRQTIRTVDRGGKVLPAPLMAALLARLVDNSLQEQASAVIEWNRLTKREREVIQFIAQGMSNKEIAQQLNLATNTVKSHVHNALEKLHVRTRGQLASHANGRSRV